jgi:hypothetical protein
MTKSYVVSISEPCGGDDPTPNDVTYTGINRKSLESISLKGHALIRYCSDDEGKRKEPCEQLGYEFKNGDTVYTVRYDGTLQVSKAKQILFEEHGEWGR